MGMSIHLSVCTDKSTLVGCLEFTKSSLGTSWVLFEFLVTFPLYKIDGASHASLNACALLVP